MDAFGEHGFAGASTRDIASRAGVNAPALQYYFENKEGLYRACVEAIADNARESFEPAFRHAQAVLAAPEAGVDDLVDAFLRLQDVIVERTLSKKISPNQRLFFAREQSGFEPTSATEILVERVRRPFNDVSVALIARISGADPEDTVTRIRAITLHGQLMIFHSAQRSTLASLRWPNFSAERLALLRETVREQSRTLLMQWYRDGQTA